MTINTCDVCKKTIPDGEVRIATFERRYQHFDLCFKCAEPVMKFLKAKKLIKPNKK